MTHEEVLDMFFKVIKDYLGKGYLVKFDHDDVVDVDVEKKVMNYEKKWSIPEWQKYKTAEEYERGLFNVLKVYKEMSRKHMKDTMKRIGKAD